MDSVELPGMSLNPLLQLGLIFAAQLRAKVAPSPINFAPVPVHPLIEFALWDFLFWRRNSFSAECRGAYTAYMAYMY